MQHDAVIFQSAASCTPELGRPTVQLASVACRTIPEAIQEVFELCRFLAASRESLSSQRDKLLCALQQLEANFMCEYGFKVVQVSVERETSSQHVTAAMS
jgi:hypothetical protein